MIFSFCRAAKYMFNAELPIRTNAIVITAIYLCGFFVAFPNTYYTSIKDGQCYPQWPSSQSVFIFYVVFISVSLLIPLGIAASMYLHIGINVGKTSGNHQHSYSKQRRRENKFLYKTMMCTVVTFGILTAPYAIFIIIYMTLLTYDQRYFFTNFNLLMSLNYVIFTMSAMNSCVNPLIYARRAQIGASWLCISCCDNGSKGGKNMFSSARSSFITRYQSSVRQQLITKWMMNNTIVEVENSI